jgi:hypothetical protein
MSFYQRFWREADSIRTCVADNFAGSASPQQGFKILNWWHDSASLLQATPSHYNSRIKGCRPPLALERYYPIKLRVPGME